VSVITGNSVSLVKLMVCEVVAVLPQASVAVHVLVIERSQPIPVSAASEKVAVRPVEQLSVTDAVPKAAAMSAAVGLHTGLVADVSVITGSSVSLVKLMVCVVEAVLPQASDTVQVLVIERSQPVPVSAASVKIAVRPVEQLSVTDAVPKAAAMLAAVGLHTGLLAAVSVITGASVSLVKLTVCVAVAVLPQASVTVHVLVRERLQPVPVSAPSLKVAVKPGEQLSVTVAVPKAAMI
jgi:hypothetical protein